MRKILLFSIAVLAAVTMSAKEYQHSVGLAGGSGVGVQYKLMINQNLTFMDELGYYGCYAAANPDGSAGYMGAINQAVFAYQSRITEGEGITLDWFAGGHFKVGYVHKFLMTPLDMDTEGGIIGVGAAGGIEANMKNAPFAFSFDFRPGYGCLLSKGWGQKKVVASHVFDWCFNLGVRYTF
jgi:hypothetical protein